MFDVPTKVLIGPMSSDPAESVSAVNRAFVEGLQTRFSFVSLPANRRFGNTRQSRLNATNCLYAVEQLLWWIRSLICERPAIAHYAISSGWAMEKGLAFVKLARWFGAKTVGHLHSGEFLDCWRVLPAWRRCHALRELQKLDGVVVLSEAWRGAVLKEIPLDPARIHVVNNPLSKSFEEAALAIPTERGENENRILGLGIMDQRKGVLDLITAAGLIRHGTSFSLEIAGPERQPGIRRQTEGMIAVNDLGNHVQVRAGLWGDEKVDAFRKSAILVLPSYFENFPLVVLEAAAAGMAIVATPVGATPEFFKHGESALLVEPGNPQQLAAALKFLIENPPERARLGTSAREVFVRRLSRDKIMASLDNAYKAVLRSPQYEISAARSGITCA